MLSSNPEAFSQNKPEIRRELVRLRRQQRDFIFGYAYVPSQVGKYVPLKRLCSKIPSTPPSA